MQQVHGPLMIDSSLALTRKDSQLADCCCDFIKIPHGEVAIPGAPGRKPPSGNYCMECKDRRAQHSMVERESRPMPGALACDFGQVFLQFG